MPIDPLPSWSPAQTEGIVVCAGALAVWALALFVISRGGFGRVPLLAALAMVALVVYQSGVSLAALAPDDRLWLAWTRVTWPGPALTPALWLVLTAALAADEAPEPLQRRLRRLFWAAAIAGPGLGLLFAAGASGDFVRRWAVLPGPSGSAERHSMPGPLYPAYLAYVLICAAWSAGNLVLLWRASAPGTPLRARFRWLIVTAVLFLLGGAYLGYAASEAALPGLPGHLLLLAGMMIMGWSIARYGALLAGEVASSDFYAYARSAAAVLLTYGAALLLFVPRDAAWFQRAVPLLLLAMATHVFADRRSPLVERLLYGRVAGTLRGQLRAIANRVARQPDTLAALVDVRESVGTLVATVGQAVPPAETVGPAVEPAIEPAAPPARFRVLVEGALRHLNDLPALSQHPLLDELAAAEPAGGTPLERAARLRAALEEGMGRLRLAGPRPMPGSSAGPGGWLHYLALHEAYAEGRLNKQIMQRYHVSEGGFHRARRRAVDALALDLYQRRGASWLPARLEHR